MDVSFVRYDSTGSERELIQCAADERQHELAQPAEGSSCEAMGRDRFAGLWIFFCGLRTHHVLHCMVSAGTVEIRYFRALVRLALSQDKETSQCGENAERHRNAQAAHRLRRFAAGDGRMIDADLLESILNASDPSHRFHALNERFRLVCRERSLQGHNSPV